MVGLVIVSHSHTLALGIREIVTQIGQGVVPVATAGGLDDVTVGTNPDRILRAIRSVWSPEGVLILTDLGSAILSAEMAIEALDARERGCVALSSAPLVEGAVAAAALIAAGASLEEVAREAQVALQPKMAQLKRPGPPSGEASGPTGPMAGIQATVTIANPLGLHVRPAALFVQVASRFDAEVRVRNVSLDTDWVNAKSLNAVTLMDARQGHQVVIEAAGRQAREALDALVSLVRSGFGEAEEPEVAPSRPAPVQLMAGTAQAVFAGIPASPGVAIGPAVFLRPHRPAASRSRPASDPATELSLLKSAMATASSQLQEMAAKVQRDLGRYSATLLEVQLALLQDPELLDQVKTLISEHQLTAEAAWDQALTALAERYRKAEGSILRARAIDIEDLRDRLLRLLAHGPSHMEVLPTGPAILVVKELPPSLASRLAECKVKAVCSIEGGPTSHAALLARSLNVPMLVGVDPDILTLSHGTLLAVDALRGMVAVSPDAEAAAHLQAQRRSWLRQVRAERRQRQLPAETPDGHRVVVAANAGSVEDAEAARELGAEGIGLLRTEFLFLGRGTPPTEEEQVELYRAVVKASAPHPVIIRTLDVGADKPPSYLDLPREANPFLGLRGLRVSLKYPDLFRTQLRAILRASLAGQVKVMFPMVSTEEELLSAMEHFHTVADELRAQGVQLDGPQVGIMLEVPSAAVMADRLARYVAFFSIGTNDLVQYLMAAERGNAHLARLYDPLHPAVLRMVAQTIEAAHRAGIWAGMCGEMAAIPEAVPILLGLGLDEFSVPPTSVPAVKAVIRRTRLASARDVAVQALNLSSGEEVRELVKEHLKTALGS